MYCSPERPVELPDAVSPQREPTNIPPYWPEDEIVPDGTPVLAMWRDRHWYHGHVIKFDGTTRYSVRFEDGGVRTVKAAELIVCDLLAVGQHCYAEREVGL